MQRATCKITSVGSRLVSWYRKHRIPYPWRQTSDPYRIWLSEILLQQTRIAVAIPYYESILRKYPTLSHLAAASESEFLAAWSGIGYYSRARNMLRCARELCANFGGRFPSDLSSLLQLPGIGPYTAGALRNICFDLLTPAIDGNVSRVLSRITRNEHPAQQAAFKTRIERAFLDAGRGLKPAEYFQSLMELGERICLPVPNCSACPVNTICLANLDGVAAALPRIAPRRKQVSYHWYLLLLKRGKTHYYLQHSNREILKDIWLFPDILSRSQMDWSRLRKELFDRFGILVSNVKREWTLPHSVTFRKIAVHVLAPSRYRIRSRSGEWLNQGQVQSRHTSSLTRKILTKVAQDPK